MPPSRKFTKTSQQNSARGKPKAGSGKTPVRAASKPSGRGSSARKAAPVRSAAGKRLSTRGGSSAQLARRPGLLDSLKGLFRRKNQAPPTRSTARSTAKPTGKTAAAPSSGMSLDRKLDLVGVVLVFVGLPTLLSLLSTNHSASTGNWLSLLGQIFGWGAFLFPMVMIIIGLWLILRNFERVPRIALERLAGLGLLFLNLLTFLHLAVQPDTLEQSFDLAQAGKGGGYLGAGFYELFVSNLGIGGTIVALLAWLLVSLTLVLDTSVANLFHWVSPLILRIQDWWDEWRTRRYLTPNKSPFPSLPTPTQAKNPTPGSSPDSIRVISPQAAGQPMTWVLPRLEDILEAGSEVAVDDEVDLQRAHTIEETLASFGAPVNVVEINRGPTITQFGVEPDFVENRGGRVRVRVGKIASLVDDLALALSARTIRVQAPVPGKGYVGIEVPNEVIANVALRDVIESDAFRRLKSPLRFAIGQDVAGHAVAADMSAMPHLLIAGATGSGKSVCVNAIIACLLLNNTPDDVRLIMVDPKRVELTGYNGIPHLLTPVVVEMERVIGALQWVLREMDQRYHKLAQLGTRNIQEYNAKIEGHGEKKLPRLVVIIDELADLMMLAPDETERSITRLAQLARATGIHLIIATQRPSVDVVTGLIKANFPSRIAFAVASGVDSRVILDQPGAERLLGRGDMLFQAPDAASALRLQGAYVSDTEIQRLVQYWLGFVGSFPAAPAAMGGVVDSVPAGIPLKQIPLWEEMEQEEQGDPLYNEALDLVRRQGRASISMLQRRLRIGYTRAARLIEAMQERGIVGTEVGPQGFEVLDYGQAAPPADEEHS